MSSKEGKTGYHGHVKVCPTQGRIEGEGAGGAHPPPPQMTCCFLIQLVFCKKKNYVVYWP